MGQNNNNYKNLKEIKRREVGKTEIERHDLFNLKNKVLGSFKSCVLTSDHYPQFVQGNLPIFISILFVEFLSSFISAFSPI